MHQGSTTGVPGRSTLHRSASTARRNRWYVHTSTLQLAQAIKADWRWSGPALYPPTSPAGYRRLLASIHSSDLDRLKQDCLYYYLLRDYERQSTGSEEDRLDGFARARRFAKTWRVFMDGYWNLDNGNWEVSHRIASDRTISLGRGFMLGGVRPGLTTLDGHHQPDQPRHHRSQFPFCHHSHPGHAGRTAFSRFIPHSHVSPYSTPFRRDSPGRC